MMSKDEWLVVRKPSIGGIIAKVTNQIVPLKFPKMLYYTHQTPLSSCSVEGGLGTRLLCTLSATLTWSC